MTDWPDWLAAFLGLWALLLLIVCAQDAIGETDVRECRSHKERN